MRVAIVGAGPAGSLLAHDLARGGARATVFDASHPREKPCGGGLTPGAARLLPAAPAHDPRPARAVHSCRFDSGEGPTVDVALDVPVLVASRSALDAWLLRRAVEQGAVHRPERVVAVDEEGGIRTAGGVRERFDVIAGADGASSLVRRTFLGPLAPSRLWMAGGWIADGDAPMLVRFTPGLPGYLWTFPREGHVEVGIGAPLGVVPTRDLFARLDAEAERGFPRLAPPGRARQAHVIPCPDEDPESIRQIAGPRWALVGDAAALADPVTGEGIQYALRSARILARTLLEEGRPGRYPRRVLADLVLGEQGYLGLEWRLFRAAPRFLLDSALARARATATN